MSEIDSGAQVGGADMDVDSLVASIESQDTGGGERAMSAPEPAAAPQKSQSELTYEFNSNGKPIRIAANDPKVTQWLSQGHSYSQRMQEFNQREQAFKAREQQIAQLQERYGPIDEYVKQNPDFWNHVTQQWESRGQTYDQNNPLARDLQQVRQELGEIKQFKQTLEQEKQAIKAADEDKALDGEIESIRKEYPDLDLNAVQPDGQSLMYHVLNYANTKGIRSFTDAFIAFNHKNLVSRAAEKAKESIGKDIQKKTKLGLLGVSSTPTKGVTRAQNVKDKSYEALLQEALEEANVS